MISVSTGNLTLPITCYELKFIFYFINLYLDSKNPQNKNFENYKRIKVAFLQFGMPLFDMTEDTFLNNRELDVFTFGRPPSSIDIMVAVKGLDFDECFKNAVFFEEEGIQIRTINIHNLISAKKAAGRHKDLNDLEKLKP